MKRFLIILIAFLAIYTTSCTNKKEVEEYPVFVCDTTTSRLSVEVKDVLNRHCFRCHGATVANSLGGGNNLENYNILKAYSTSGILLDDITHAPGANPMPKSAGKIPDCDINKIRAWINRGSLNN